MDPYFQEPAKPPQPEKKPRGCLFYGCLISAILAVLAVLAITAMLYFGYRFLVNTAKEYTETTPVPLPAVTMPADQRKQLEERFHGFTDAVKEDKATEPIVLTADDLNALIDDNPNLKGKLHVEIDGDRVKGQISFPMKDLGLGIGELSDRYLNGSAVLNVSLVSGMLDVRADEIVVKGKPLPEQFVNSLRGRNLAENAGNDPKARNAMDKLERIEVKDGTVILTPRVRPKPADDTKAADPAKPEAGKTPDEPAEGADAPKADAPKPDDTPKPAEPPKDDPKADAPKAPVLR